MKWYVGEEEYLGRNESFYMYSNGDKENLLEVLEWSYKSKDYHTYTSQTKNVFIANYTGNFNV